MDLELKDIDCNCNDCKYLVRDLEKYAKSVELARSVAKWSFDNTVERIRANAEKQRVKKGNLEAWDNLHTEADKMVFQFSKKSCRVQYGRCSKLNIDISFLPSQCQPHTQECFEKR